MIKKVLIKNYIKKIIFLFFKQYIKFKTILKADDENSNNDQLSL
jgi:hypothetical protein